MSSTAQINAIGDGSANMLRDFAIITNDAANYSAPLYRAKLVYNAFQDLGEIPPWDNFEALEKTKSGKLILACLHSKEKKEIAEFLIGKQDKRISDNVRWGYVKKELTEFALQSIEYAASKGWKLS